MSTERGNYRLITEHAPFLAIAPITKKPLAIVLWKPWVTDWRWKIQGDVLHGILPPKYCIYTCHALRVYSPPKFPLRPLSQTFLRIPKQYFVFVSSPRKQTHTVCNNRPNIVDLSYRGQTAKLNFGLARWQEKVRACTVISRSFARSVDIREFKITTTATATGTSLNKRFNKVIP